MAVLSLKTEWDVAELLLVEGWFPEEINGILVFPLPKAAFRHLGSQHCLATDGDVIQATAATPTTIYRARQLLESAGWLDRELDSLLKPYLYGDDAWANQTIHKTIYNAETQLPRNDQVPSRQLRRSYRHTMALKRIGSLALVITLVFMAVVWLA